MDGPVVRFARRALDAMLELQVWSTACSRVSRRHICMPALESVTRSESGRRPRVVA